MGRYRTCIDRDRLPHMLKAGYGQGTGPGYRPWIEVIHLPSHGLVCRVRGLTTRRVHHLLSQLETMYWYVLDWAPSVVDIREQFPLLPIEQPAALPTMRRYDEIVAALATGQAQILADDPYARLLARAETGIPPSQLAIRDARWPCIDVPDGQP